MIRPPTKKAPGRDTEGARSCTPIVATTVGAAHRDLQLLAHNPREPFVAGAEQEAAR